MIQATVTKRLDSLLCHLEWVLCLMPEGERRAERDSLFSRNWDDDGDFVS